MRPSLLALLLVASLAACDSAADGPPEAALTALYDGEVSREGPAVPLPEALSLADLVRLPVAPERPNDIRSEYRTLGADGQTLVFFNRIFLVEERRDGSVRVLTDTHLSSPDPDRVGLFVFAPAALLDGRTEATVTFRGVAARDSLVLRSGAGLLGPDRAAPLTIDPLTPTQSLGALVRGIDRAAPRVTPVLFARYQPLLGCRTDVAVTTLVRNPRREPLYATPADTTALGPCQLPPAPARLVPVEAFLVLLSR